MTRLSRARAAAAALGDVPMQLAALENMTVNALRERYQELYGELTNSRNKPWLRKRLSWRIQELAHGGMSQRSVTRISELSDRLPERWRMRLAAAPAAAEPLEEQRDSRLPASGGALERVYKGVLHRVIVEEGAFDYNGQKFRTLSAVAKKITGRATNGFTFFGTAERSTPVEAEARP